MFKATIFAIIGTLLLLLIISWLHNALVRIKVMPAPATETIEVEKIEYYQPLKGKG